VEVVSGMEAVTEVEEGEMAVEEILVVGGRDVESGTLEIVVIGGVVEMAIGGEVEIMGVVLLVMEVALEVDGVRERA